MFGFFKKRTIGDVIKAGEQKKLTRLLNGNSVNMRDDKGHTPLFYALKHVNRQALKLVLQHNAELSMGDNNELLPKLVLDTSNPEIITLMLEHGLKLHTVIEPSGEQLPTLHYLIKKRVINYRIFRVVIEYGVDINAQDCDKHTPILFAVKNAYCDRKIVELLIEYGCQLDCDGVNTEASLLYNALFLDRRSSREALELFDILLPHMLSAWEQDQLSLLSSACIYRSAEIFIHLCSRLTCDAKADFLSFEHFFTARNFTPTQQERLKEINASKGLHLPLDFATPKETGGLAPQGLRYEGATLPPVMPPGTLPPVMELVSKHRADKATLQQLQSLLQDGSPIEENGRSALLIAAGHLSIETMKLLITHGADPLFVDKSGATLLPALIHRDAKGRHRHEDIVALHSILSMLSTTLEPQVFNKLIERPFTLDEESKPVVFIEYIARFETLNEAFYKLIASTTQSAEHLYTLITQIEPTYAKSAFEALAKSTIPRKDRGNILEYMLSHPVGAEGLISFLDCCELTPGDPVLSDIISRYDANFYSQEAIIDICNHAITHGVSINYINHSGESVLSAAIKRGALKVVEWAISCGADIDAPMGKEKLPLQLYVCRQATSNSLAILELLDSYGKLNIKDGGMYNVTPLLAASRACAVELVEYLIDKGADIEAREHEGQTTPLIAAITYDPAVRKEQRLQCIALLLSRGANINGQGSGGITPLMCACSYGALSASKLLLEKGADVTLTDERGHNAINYLSLGSWDYEYRKNQSFNEVIRANILKALVAKGAAIDNVPSGKNCFPAIIDALGYNHLHLFNAFIECGADINIKDRKGTPLLHFALGYNAPRYVKVLLDNPATNVGAVASDNSSAWHVLSAVTKDDHVRQFAALLRKRWVPIEPNAYDEHPLHRAVLSGNLALVRYLLAQDNRAVNHKDDNGRTPIFNLFATKESGANKAQICQVLLEAGAKLNIRNSEGATPLELSEEAKMPTIHALLLNSGADDAMGQKKTRLLQ